MNKLISPLLFTCSTFLSMQSFGLQPHSGLIHSSPPPPFASDRILVNFKPGSAASEIGAAHRQAGGHTLKIIPGIGVHVVQVPHDTVLDKVSLYQANPNVEYAEPDFNRILILPDETSDDPLSNDFGFDYFSEQWGLDNTGQLLTDPQTGEQTLFGSVDADIDAPEGWDITTGSAGIIIAMLDTGIDCSGNLEFSGKCIDQQNFVSSYSNTVTDLVGHGTHTAGIAAAHTDNSLGIAGVGWNSSVANLKTCYEYTYDLYPPLGFYVITGVCPVSASAEAIAYAANQGYHVVNMSYASDEIDPDSGEPVGVSTPPNTETAAVTYAWNQGVLLVAAAGNNNDTTRVYPAALPEVVAVAATDRYDDRASFSSFGNNWVSLLAPGDNILSTIPNDQCEFYSEILGFPFDPATDACLDWYSGTSMASPHVAGAAALVWHELFPGKSGQPALASCVDSSGTPCNEVVRNHLEGGADTTGALGQNFLAWSQHGRLNLAGALGRFPLPVLPPSAPDNLTVLDNTDGSATVAWKDNSVNETGFELEREKQRKNGAWTGPTSLIFGANVTGIIDQTGTGTFRYRVRSLGTTAHSAWTDWTLGTVSDNSGSGGKGGGKPSKKK